MPKSVKTFLMFDGAAEEAVRLYVSVFRGAVLLSLSRWADGEPGTPGTVKAAELVIAGHRLVAVDSPVKHRFTFTPAISFFVDCESAEEQTTVYEKLMVGGTALMPLGDYGFSKKFGWVSDRFGVSWQLNLP
jgi:predicted 3-demethylubiquinone-9 3-methyltransferase (glyoxalase superfamily)